jgi:hypothetical protein
MEEIVEDRFEMQTSKINSGFLQVQRLDTLWRETHNAAKVGNYKLWNEMLDRIWCELGGDVREGDENEKKYDMLLREYAQIIMPNKKGGFDIVSDEERLSIVKQKMILIKKELFLRRLQNIQGKGTAYDDSEDEEPE